MTLRPMSRVVAARGDRGRAQPRCPFGTQQRHGGEGDQSTEGDPVSNDVDRVEDTYGRVSLRASRQQGDRRLDEAGGEPESRSGEDAPAKGPRDSAACCDVEGAQLLEETFPPPYPSSVPGNSSIACSGCRRSQTPNWSPSAPST